MTAIRGTFWIVQVVRKDYVCEVVTMMEIVLISVLQKSNTPKFRAILYLFFGEIGTGDSCPDHH